jgi:hypothetical protein
VRGWIGFEIVKRCDRLRTGPEYRMGGDVVDPLSEIQITCGDGATVDLVRHAHPAVINP